MLAYTICEVDDEAWEFWGCVLYFVAKLASPFPFQHMRGCSERVHTMLILTSGG